MVNLNISGFNNIPTLVKSGCLGAILDATRYPDLGNEKM